MDANFVIDLACALLECDSDGLTILSRSRYDMHDIIDAVKENRSSITLNDFLHEIFCQARQDLKEAISSAICDRDDELEYACDSMGERRLMTEIKELESLDPENDMDWLLNRSDTYCSLRKEELYRKYIPGELEEIQKNMGFQFSN